MSSSIESVAERGKVDKSSNRAGSRNGTGLDSVKGLRSRQIIEQGANSVAGAARLAIAAAEDMLLGNLTPGEATVLNTAAGRVLKASELFLKYGRGENKKLLLPEIP